MGHEKETVIPGPQPDIVGHGTECEWGREALLPGSQKGRRDGRGRVQRGDTGETERWFQPRYLALTAGGNVGTQNCSQRIRFRDFGQKTLRFGRGGKEDWAWAWAMLLRWKRGWEADEDPETMRKVLPCRRSAGPHPQRWGTGRWKRWVLLLKTFHLKVVKHPPVFQV